MVNDIFKGIFVDDLEDDHDLISETLLDCHTQRLKEAGLEFEASEDVQPNRQSK